MPRSMDPAISDDLRKPLSPHALLAFLVIDNDYLTDPIRVVSDPLDFIVDGELYIGVPFDIQVINDSETHPTAKLRLQNVDRAIGTAVQQAIGRITVDATIRSTAGFNLSVVPRVPTGQNLILSLNYYELVEVTVTDVEVAGTLILRDYTQEPWPSGRATKARCPGLY